MLIFIKLLIEQARSCVHMGAITSYSFSQYDDYEQ